TLDANKEVLPLIGSKEGIMHISMTFLNKDDEVLVPDPGYPSYRSASKLAGATCIAYDLKEDLNWQPDLEALEQRDLSRVKIMWINYPQMPTGTKADPELFKKLVAFAKRNQILLCHDNPYSFILPPNNEIDPQPLSILSIDGANEVALELNSLSKSHNMAGWRIGVLAANEEIIQSVMRFKSNMDSGTFLPMQRAAAHALSLNSDWYKTLNEVYIERKEKAKELLDLIGCTYKEGQQGLFIWAKVSDEYEDGYALSDRFLYNARVFITPGGIFGKNGNQYVRISLCSMVDTLNEAISRVKEVLEKKNSQQKISISE
ncbi:MAG TPA: aminotransferase class I/II-fold pyridoxal phosphate-dependent enzyme, partial [Chitinophagaceae bacterium]|nr:aminotransferase class I/II-fold pyridoxal phosphate-dependent enzyme [Chitinophagaceae bacterium]